VMNSNAQLETLHFNDAVDLLDFIQRAT
jgi:hypothetical protein